MKFEKLSRRIGINLDYFLPRGLWVGGRFFVTTFLALLTSVAFARFTSKEIYGQYQYVLSIVGLLSVLSLPGLNTAALRAFVEGDETSVAQSVRYGFFFSLLATIVLLTIATYDAYNGKAALGLAIGIAAVLQPFFYAPNNWYIYYEGKLDFRSSTVRLVVFNCVLLIAMVLSLKAALPLAGLIAVYFGLSALMSSVLFWEGKQTVTSTKTKNKLNLNYAFRCTLQKFTTTIGENIQAIAISWLFGFASLAIYQVAQSFVNAFVGLMGALGSTYFPLLLKYKRLNHKTIIIQHLMLGLGFWVIYLLALRWLFGPLYGVKYEDAISLAHRLSFIVFLLPLRVYLTNFFSARDQNHLVTATNLVASVLALSIFYLMRHVGFSQAAVIYLYTLNLAMTITLFGLYVSDSSRNDGRKSSPA